MPVVQEKKISYGGPMIPNILHQSQKDKIQNQELIPQSTNIQQIQEVKVFIVHNKSVHHI